MVLSRIDRQILVVDDDPFMARALRRTLAAWDPDVARDGPEALAHLETADYRLVLCDLQMPDVSGVDVFERAVAERPELAERFVFLSGGGHEGLFPDFFAQPARAVLLKPFKPQDLMAVLERFGLTNPEPET